MVPVLGPEGQGAGRDPAVGSTGLRWVQGLWTEVAVETGQEVASELGWGTRWLSRGVGAGGTFWNQTQVTVVQHSDTRCPELFPLKWLSLCSIHFTSSFKKPCKTGSSQSRQCGVQVPGAAGPPAPLPAPLPVLPQVRLKNKCSVPGGRPHGTVMPQRVEKGDGNFLEPHPQWRPQASWRLSPAFGDQLPRWWGPVGPSGAQRPH